MAELPNPGQQHEMGIACVGKRISEKLFSRELPETGVGRRHILGVLRLALIPLPAPVRAKAARSGDPVPRDSRGAQDDKSEMISSKETIFATGEIQTDPLPTVSPNNLAAFM